MNEPPGAHEVMYYRYPRRFPPPTNLADTMHCRAGAKTLSEKRWDLNWYYPATPSRLALRSKVACAHDRMMHRKRRPWRTRFVARHLIATVSACLTCRRERNLRNFSP